MGCSICDEGSKKDSEFGLLLKTCFHILLDAYTNVKYDGCVCVCVCVHGCTCVCVCV